VTFLVSCSSLPERTYSVHLWKIDWETRCVSRMLNDNSILKFCHGDKDFPPHLIGIKASDYAKERNYQDKLKEACR
jgi:hypothetical protein